MRHLIDFLFRRALLTFALMGMFFMLFGVTSVNLFFVLKANISLFIDYGAMVIDDGALRQLFGLAGMGLLSAGFLLACSVCERVLVKRLMTQWVASRAH
jgi:hypothetical protein